MKSIRPILFKTALRFDGKTINKLGRLREWQTEKNKQNRLQQILTHAYENVPYYERELSRIGINNADDIDSESLKQIPILNKKKIRENYQNLQAENINKRNWFEKRSGGSTGEPITVIQDDEYREWSRAVSYLFNEWSGYQPGEPRILLWGSEEDVFKTEKGTKSKIKTLLKNEHWLNSFRMTSKDMENYIDTINRVQPKQILAYADSAYQFSKLINERNIDVYSPHAVMTSAGTLHPHMRKEIESAFNSPVFNRYGTREVGDIASECSEQDGLHVCEPAVHVEILDENNNPVSKGELGQVVVTSLTNYSMPLIRYRIGDMAVKGGRECSCGCNWMKLREVAGRVTDMFITQEGDVVSPNYFIHLLGVVIDAGWINRYQIVQQEYDHIQVSIQTDISEERLAKPHNKQLNEIRDKIQKVMGDDCRVSFEFREEIPPTDSGKYRYTISKVAK